MKLKNLVKVILIFAIIGIIIYEFIDIANSRINKIENGEMTLVNQNQMDR